MKKKSRTAEPKRGDNDPDDKAVKRKKKKGNTPFHKALGK